MKKIKFVKSSGFTFEVVLDNLQVRFNVGYSNEKEITDYRILTSLNNEWYLLDELKFSFGTPIKSVFLIKKLVKNAIQLTPSQLRDIRLELLLQEDND